MTQAAEVDFSYNPERLPQKGFGFGKKETYDVAIYVNDASLAGSTVKGISVPLEAVGSVSATSAWLSSELRLKKKNGKNVNDPDILIQDGDLSDGTLTVMFDTPYHVTGPFYAGYSFTVDNLDVEASKTPVAVAEIIDYGGLFIHSSRTKFKWIDCTEEAQGVSVMKVLIDGDFKDNSASFLPAEGLYVSAEERPLISVDVINHGMNPISSITYTYSGPAGSGNGSAEFDPAVAGAFGARKSVEIDLGSVSCTGTSDLTLDITSVNGLPNNDVSPQTVMPLKVYPFIPVNRPLVEEYTGLWCGWCVRGYVALETMKERYPDQFIGLAYHDGDPMEPVGLERPSFVTGYPSAFINRNKTKLNISELYTVWPEFIKTIAPASVDVSISWTDDTKTAIKAVSTSRFIEDYTNADFAVCYALIQDDMSDPSWAQYNAYASEENKKDDYPEMPGELGKLFTEGPAYVYGLTYNDVVLALPQPSGYPGSVPAAINAGEEIKHSCIIPIDGIESVKGGNPIQNKSRLRVVASIIDRKTGLSVNCNTSDYIEPMSADLMESDDNIRTVIYHDLQGRRINRPVKGIYIRTSITEKGSITTEKITN